MLLCPNHYLAIHRLDASVDWNEKGFVFGMKVQRLELVEHDLARGT
jgi:hypothetical protein